LVLKVSKLGVFRRWTGNSFQRKGPACAKDRSPQFVLTFGTTIRPVLEERRRLGGLYGLIRLTLYSGADPCTQ